MQNTLCRPLKQLLFVSWLTLSGIAYSAEYQSHQLQGQSLNIQTDEGQLTLSAYNPFAFEVFYQPANTKQLPSFAIGNKPLATEVSLDNQPQSLRFNAPGISAVIEKSPLRISYYQGDKLLLEEEVGLFNHDTLRGFRFKLQANEKLLGGGERILGMDRRGYRFPLYNKAHYGYTTESNQMYFGLPAVMSNNKYLLVFDNSAKGYMDLGATESNIMQFEAVGGRTSYIVVAGQTYPDLIEHYVEVTGKQPLPPRWALGNFASRFGYRTEQETRATVQRFIDQDFPLDAVVLDLYWFGPDIKGHMGNLAWDKAAFPNPTQMIADFKALGVKTVLITEPFILSSSSKWASAVKHNALAKNLAGQPRQFDFYFGNTGLIDVFDDNASAWFNQVYSELFQQGVAGWWGDLGEPEVHPADAIHQLDGQTVTGDEIHNVYGHQWAQRVYQHQLSMAPQQRPFIMMRSGFVGSQRYGMIPWTGDVSRSWDGLKPQVELSLQMGLLGMGYTHSDLGGFAGGEEFDQELYIRWLQYGVFQPVFRPHAQDNIAPEPVFHDQQTQNILRRYIKLRYAMLPYNYSLAYQNSLTGLPLMRPMFFENEHNSKLIDNKDQYFWGDAFLIKPVTGAGTNTVSMALPPGHWFNYWTDKHYPGAQSIELPVTLSTLPVMVRAGAFVPMVPPVQSTDDYRTDKLVLHYYAHESVESAQGKMYDDDGINPNAIATKQFEVLTFNASQTLGNLQIDLARKGEYPGMPVTRQLTVEIHNWLNKVENIQLAGHKLTLHPSEMTFEQQPSGAFWNEAEQRLTVKFAWQQNTRLSVITR